MIRARASRAPSGSVTLLFTDVEGSTRLLNELGAEAYEDARAERRRLSEAFARHGGVEVDTQGSGDAIAVEKPETSPDPRTGSAKAGTGPAKAES